MSHLSRTTPLTGLSRRGFLSAAGGIGAAAVTGTALSGCSGPKTTPAERNANSVPLPTHVPYTRGKPDLPGDQAKSISDGYLSYPLPADQVQTVDGQVGGGGTVNNMVVTFSPPPAALDKNAYWQAINAALNVKLTSTLVPGEFPTKLAAVLTSNQIPDLLTMYPAEAWGLRRYESVVQDKFADLSPYLSGDAVKEYPNLARLAPETWQPTLVAGKLYATPTLRIPTGSAVFCRSDKISSFGANPKPTSSAEFDELCRTITSVDDKRYALANEGSWLSTLFYPMFGVPNGWRRDEAGGLTSYLETEEWQAAIAFIAETWKKKYWHPDGAGATSFDIEPLFANGSVMIRSDNFVRYTVRGKLAFTVDLIEPFLAGGGPAAQFEVPATDFLTFIKKGDEARVTECLRVINFLSAPLGSKENFLRTYGAEGADHTITDGRPTLTERGQAETTSLSLRFVAGGPDVLFAANGDQTMVNKLHAYQTAVSSNRVQNPVAGLYAESASRTGQITQQVTDTMNDVILGRKPQSALAEVVTKWRNGGGDKLREEYQAALALRQ